MVKKFIVLLMILKICGGRMNHLRLEHNDDIIKLITHAGYKAEAYVVTTDDGYFLKIHRLLPKLRTNKKPVFLMHGIVATAADFLITGPKVALAYLLADNGYDVWLGNARGSKHSMLHRNFTADSKNFYNFSWHEIGYYDLPAMIDFMLQKTRSPNAFYVAHSQGTTSLLVLLSTRPEYNNKIIQAHLMAPASFCSHSPHPLVRPFGLSMKFGLFKDNHYLDLADIWTFLKFLTKFYCKEKTTPSIESCEGAVLALSLFFGANENEIEIDTRMLDKLVSHVSPRVGKMQFEHYFQLLFSGRFRNFDYDHMNSVHYNSKTPPNYKINLIKASMFLYHAEGDLLLSKVDVKHLRNRLPNVKHFRVIPNWNHVDFVYGRNARKVLYNDILRSFETIR